MHLLQAQKENSGRVLDPMTTWQDNIFATVPVKTDSASYDVVIGRSFVCKLDDILQDTIAKQNLKPVDRVFFVSDSNVWKIYADKVVADFSYDFDSYVFPAGEQSKNPKTLVECLEKMAQSGCTRDSVVITLGGGVACDFGGFAAATYMRGIRVLQVPTSLLAMVDASVGGKTAVDLKAGKNLFGAFHQPIGVVVDLNVLSTLGDDQFKDSVGEIVKHAILADPELFDFLSNNKLVKSMISTDDFAQVVMRNVEIKRDVVNADEHEAGIRQTLNLGHTIGHAIEAASNFSVGHGTCVAAGLCVLVRACAKAGLTSSDVAEKIISSFNAQDLPTTTKIDKQTLIKFIKNDKKRHSNSVNFVLVNNIGSCSVKKFTFEEIDELLS